MGSSFLGRSLLHRWDFFAAFGHDAVGAIGTPTTITSGDLDGIVMIAAQSLEKRTVEQRKEINCAALAPMANRASLTNRERCPIFSGYAA